MSKWADRLTFRMNLFSTGLPFDPSDQKRTDGLRDLVKQNEEEDDKKLKKQFEGGRDGITKGSGQEE